MIKKKYYVNDSISINTLQSQVPIQSYSKAKPIDIYKNKYYKYKTKYLKLKNYINNSGGEIDYKNRNSWIDMEKRLDEKICIPYRNHVKGSEYLSKVIGIQNIDILLKNLFLNLGEINDQNNEISTYKFLKTNNIVYNLINEMNKKKSKVEWVKCVSDCQNILKNLIDIELESTAYILRVLSNSVINIESNNTLVFNISDESRLTGKWDNDKNFISINTEKDIYENRLIMGFGPSASGKTHWAKKVIDLLNKTQQEFPDIFLAIDGGIARDKSIIYQIIINNINKLCSEKYILGFKNLFSKKLFKSPKSKIIDFLKEEKNNNKISLYVPETLGKCYKCRFNTKSCKCADLIINDFIKITNDKNWIGLYIWQHLKDCDKPDEFKCEGTQKSGKSREIKEGKKYSSIAYFISERSGRIALCKAPGGRLDIHNSGSKDRKSVITDYNIDGKYLFTNNKENIDIITTYNAKYETN